MFKHLKAIQQFSVHQFYKKVCPFSCDSMKYVVCGHQFFLVYKLVLTNTEATFSGNSFAKIAKLDVINAALPDASTERTRIHIAM